MTRPSLQRLVARVAGGRRVGQLLAVFGLVLVLGLLMSRPSDGNGWFADDPWHIRTYTGAELAHAWTGTWEPTGVGTTGYRPLQPLSAHLRSELLGEESPKKSRYLHVGIAALALTVLAAALWRLGVPLYVGLGAAAIEFTARNFVFTYAWASGGYHAQQMLIFGLALLALTAVLAGAGRRRTLLVASAALWAVSLLLKDQGLFLLPALLALALVGPAPRRYAERHPDGALDYGRLWSVLRDEAKAQWRRTDTRAYLVAIVALAVADVFARFVFVGGPPDTGGPLDAWNDLLLELGYVVGLAGPGQSEALYWALAGFVLVIALVAPALAPRRAARDLATPWMVALFAVLGLATSIAFAPAQPTQHLVTFPLYFYALLVCASVVLAVRMLAPYRRALRAAAVGIAAIGAVSLVSSIRASTEVQHAMGPWSIDTLKYEYDYTYGPTADRMRIPPARRAAMKAHLAQVGLTGPRQSEPDDVLPYLYCRAQQDKRIRIPHDPAFVGRAVYANLNFVCPYIDGALR